MNKYSWLQDDKTTKMFKVLCDATVKEVEGSSSYDDDDDHEHVKGVCDIYDDGGNVL